MAKDIIATFAIVVQKWGGKYLGSLINKVLGDKLERVARPYSSLFRIL